MIERGAKVQFKKTLAHPRKWRGKEGIVIKRSKAGLVCIMNEHGDEFGPLILCFHESEFEVLEGSVEI